MASGNLEVRALAIHLQKLLLSFLCSFDFTGAILEEAVKEGEDPRFKGSIMLAFAESEGEVLKALREDIYFKEDVWDWHKVQIQPVCLEVPSLCIQSV